MRTIIGGAVLVVLAAVAAPLTPAVAASGAGHNGCVSNAAYAKLANGQRLSYVRAAAGDEAQTSWRSWSRGSLRYQEHLYRMCTPTDSAHGTLTTRFMHWQGAWRAYIVDTHVGPE